MEVIDILGEEKLLYKAFPIDITFIRGTYADELGNVTVQQEIGTSEVTRSGPGGQEQRRYCSSTGQGDSQGRTLDPRLVKVPRIYVDAIVVTEDPIDHQQSFDHDFEPSLCGDIQVPVSSLEAPPLSAKKVIGRRAAMELRKDTVVNLGIGIPEYISAVANEEGIGDWMTLTVEAGPVGGVPCGGSQFGASVNPECILCQHEQFDFYDGGGVDLAFLGLAQADMEGNINVSKFGPRLAGCGGFINITPECQEGVLLRNIYPPAGLKIAFDKRRHKDPSGRKGQEVHKGGRADNLQRRIRQKDEAAGNVHYRKMRLRSLRTTDFTLPRSLPELIFKKDILDLMDFTPKMDGTPKLMDASIFRDELMGLAK